MYLVCRACVSQLWKSNCHERLNTTNHMRLPSKCRKSNKNDKIYIQNRVDAALCRIRFFFTDGKYLWNMPFFTMHGIKVDFYPIWYCSSARILFFGSHCIAMWKRVKQGLFVKYFWEISNIFSIFFGSIKWFWLNAKAVRWWSRWIDTSFFFLLCCMIMIALIYFMFKMVLLWQIWWQVSHRSVFTIEISYISSFYAMFRSDELSTSRISILLALFF